MELEKLLNDQGWEESDLDFSSRSIESDIRRKVQNRIKDLVYQYRKVIGFNLFFLIVFSSVWFIVPVWETLIPIGIIAGSYLFMISSVIVNLWRYEKPSPDLPLPELIRSMLAYNKKIFKQLGDFQPLIVAACSMAGMMLGLLIQRGSIDVLLFNPFGLAGMLLVTGLIYYAAIKGGVALLNRAFNPRYFKATTYLKEQLAELETDDVEKD